MRLFTSMKLWKKEKHCGEITLLLTVGKSCSNSEYFTSLTFLLSLFMKIKPSCKNFEFTVQINLFFAYFQKKVVSKKSAIKKVAGKKKAAVGKSKEENVAILGEHELSDSD